MNRYEIIHCDSHAEPRRADKMLAARSGSSISTPSVTSISNRLAGSPVRERTPDIVAGRSQARNCAGETLTATQSGTGHLAAASHAVSRTHWPISMISRFPPLRYELQRWYQTTFRITSPRAPRNHPLRRLSSG